jgi:hypothetical protein
MTKYTKIEQMVHEMFALRQSYSLDRYDERAVKNDKKQNERKSLELTVWCASEWNIKILISVKMPVRRK